MTEARIYPVTLQEGQDATFVALPTKIDGTPIVLSDVNADDSESEEDIYGVWAHVYELDSTLVIPGSKSGVVTSSGVYPGTAPGLVMRRMLERGLTRGSTMQATPTIDKRWPHGAPGYTFRYKVPYRTTAHAVTDDLDAGGANAVHWRAGNVYRVEFTLTTDTGDSGVGGAGIGRCHVLFDVTVIDPGIRTL